MNKDYIDMDDSKEIKDDEKIANELLDAYEKGIMND